MYAPHDRLEMPYRTVRALFHRTVLDLGCHETEAMIISQSVWHLTNRGLDGVDYALRYLAALQADTTLPRLTAAPLAMDMADKLNSGERRQSAFIGMIAPLLLLPAASFDLDEHAATDGILFTFNDQIVVYSKSHGMRVESNDPAELMLINPLDTPTCTASRVDFTENTGNGIEFPRTKQETLALPKSVFAGPEAPLNLIPLLS